MKKGLSIRFVMLLFLFISMVIPLLFVTNLTKNNIRQYFSELEEEYEGALLDQRISPSRERISIYSELINFVSKLPAVLEIYGRGKSRAGSISREKAIARYTGVLTRAFRSYPDIVSVHMYELDGTEQLSVEKQSNGTFKTMSLTDLNLDSSSNNSHHHWKMFQHLIETIDSLSTTPVITAEYHSYEETENSLILQLMIPIFHANEIIGIFIADIDLGILSQEYPNIYWYLNNGTPLQKMSQNIFQGLDTLFRSQKAAILETSNGKYTWTPLFYQANNNKPIVWAGEKIKLEGTQQVQKKSLQTILFASLTMVLFVILYTAITSTFLTHFFRKLLTLLEDILLHDKKSNQLRKTNIKEIDSFLEKLEELFKSHYILKKEKEAENREKDRLNRVLQEKLDQIQTLEGLVPICANCKNIRDDNGYWEQVESYVSHHSKVKFSHSICPNCIKKLYGEDFYKDDESNSNNK